MSEVKRYALRLFNEWGGYSPNMVYPESLPNPGSRPEYVLASDYDAAQSELAALREELAKLKAQLETWNHLDLQRDARLAAAEQRNAEGSAAIQLACTFLNRSLANLNPSRQLFKDIREFLKDNDKPTESGASE